MEPEVFPHPRRTRQRLRASVTDKRLRTAPCAITSTSPQRCPPATERRLTRLLERAGVHDQGAFGLFYDATCNKVFGMVLSVVPDRVRAEAVAEAVYVEAWRLAPTFDADFVTPTGWLAAIAGRQLTDSCWHHDTTPPLP